MSCPEAKRRERKRVKRVKRVKKEKLENQSKEWNLEEKIPIVEEKMIRYGFKSKLTEMKCRFANYRKIILDEMKIPKAEISPQGARHRISFLKNKLITPSAATKKASLVIDKTYASIYKTYQLELAKNNSVDFDDLLLLPLKIFEENFNCCNFQFLRKRFVKIKLYWYSNSIKFCGI